MMLLHVAVPSRCSTLCPYERRAQPLAKKHSSSFLCSSTSHRIAAAVVAATAVATVVFSASAIEVAAPPQSGETLLNIPQTLSSVCTSEQKDCKKRYKFQKPKSRKAETCTSKCVNTCIQGGFGSPGEGPLNIRRPLVVFKEGFRSRKYCLSECSDICNLIGDGDDGP